MPRIYFPPEQIKTRMIIRDYSVVHKITRVIRLRPGDSLFIFDGKGKEYSYKVTNISGRELEIEKTGLSRSGELSGVRVSLAFPMMREAKVDFILQRATELGISRFLPFFCSGAVITTVPSLTRINRWNKIIREACRQSGRLWLPDLSTPVDFPGLLREQADLKLEARIQGDPLNKAVFAPGTNTVLLAVGPEGDFSVEEKEAFSANKFLPVAFSVNILRSETAAVFFSGLIKYFIDYNNES